MKPHYPKLIRRSQYPTRSRYLDYRWEIREDCQYRCVYCDIDETWLGGKKAMQLDHYRPKKLFQDLENDPNNLVWVCATCNRAKYYDWHPIDPTTAHSVSKGYLDPFVMDRNEFFKIESDGSITPLSGPALYMIKRLLLDRQWLNTIRCLRQTFIRLNQFFNEYSKKELEKAEQHYKLGHISKKSYDKQVEKIELLRELFQDILIQHMPQE